MPKSLQQLRQHIQESRQEHFKELCNKIDQEMDDWDGKSPICVYEEVDEILYDK
jgi:hypothetical protein